MVELLFIFMLNLIKHFNLMVLMKIIKFLLLDLKEMMVITNTIFILYFLKEHMLYFIL